MTRRTSVMLALLLAGCARPGMHRQAVPPPPPAGNRTAVPVVAPLAPAPHARRPSEIVERCPPVADIRRLRAARPQPLRRQPMPATPAERVARTAAQLGQYEAQGAWADQVEEMLAKCDPP